MIAMTDQLLNLQPSQKKADEMIPTRAKKTIGCHFPWRRLKAAKATTSNQPLANFHSRDCTENSSDSEVRPTAIEASTPTTATAYNPLLPIEHHREDQPESNSEGRPLNQSTRA
jgi:hypothetical protein